MHARLIGESKRGTRMAIAPKPNLVRTHPIRNIPPLIGGRRGILNLGSGKEYIWNAYNVDKAARWKPDLKADLFTYGEDELWRLLGSDWQNVTCKNVINYAPNYAALSEFFNALRKLLAKDGECYLEFMNVANHEGLRLHYLLLKPMFWDAGLTSTLLTKRHLLVPTGNVKVLLRVEH